MCPKCGGVCKYYAGMSKYKPDFKNVDVFGEIEKINIRYAIRELVSVFDDDEMQSISHMGNKGKKVFAEVRVFSFEFIIKFLAYTIRKTKALDKTLE